MPSEDSPPAPARSAAYDRVEGLHLRQWALRPVPLMAALLTNGRGLVDVPWFPQFGRTIDGTGIPWMAVAGGVLVLVSAVFRVAAKGVLVRKTTLTTGGVYAWCRHPFYAANLWGALGTFLLAGPIGFWAGALWLVIAGRIYRITIRGEESGLAELYPVQWGVYEAEVAPLLPVPWRRGSGPPLEVTWANLVAEREPPRLLRFLGGALLVMGLALPSVALLWTGAGFFAVSYVVPLLTGGGRRSKS